MADNKKIITLYTELAQNPHRDFGWAKGLQNAKAHGYKQDWMEAIKSPVWDFCAAVGNPFKEAEIHKGDTILDLGCGAGVDVLVASHLVGKEGKVYGVDITPEMVKVAREHTKELNATNVEILESSFDKITLEDESIDVVLSNGAINLTSCKKSVFAEIYRLLKQNGKLYFADMIDISIDEGSCCLVEQSACYSNEQEDWANCVAGTMRESELIELIKKSGFRDVVCCEHTHYTTAKTTQGATFKAIKKEASKIREEHWEGIFQTADYTQVLWHQNFPQKSLDLIKKYTNKQSSILDVGCGASLLVDVLIEEGYNDITLLDTSKIALDIVKKRVEKHPIHYISSDILVFKSEQKFYLWHDRAVFHFLLTTKEQRSYFNTLVNSLKIGAFAIISTFRVDGPTKCSGLNIVQYDAKKLQRLLPLELKLESFEEYLHITPKGTDQKYIYFVIKRSF